MDLNKTCVCVIGWHYDLQFYLNLNNVPNVDIYIISHKKGDCIPEELYRIQSIKAIFVEPNFGYDWGGYQQFIEKGVWKKYEITVFMHDDIVIKRNDFIEKVSELLGSYTVVGNGRSDLPRNWPATHPESYFHSSWYPTNLSFVHDTVRGSFFATTRDSLSNIGKFEVFWDRYHGSTYFGNWSLRATCAKWQYHYGTDCFGFLADQSLESEWLLELVRGQEVTEVIEHRNVKDKIISHLIYTFSRHYMKKIMRCKDMHLPIYYRVIASVLRYLGGKEKCK